jgi:DME family drug/metabolite transporter
VSGRPLRARDLTWLVALGAGLWGTDSLFRADITVGTAAPTIVFVEHLMLVLVLSPWLVRSVRAWRRARRQVQVAVLAIGIGASAVATTLFTLAFQHAGARGDFVTPVVVQHLQPLFAIAGAVLLLRERIRGRFLVFALPALVGVWLLAFPDPGDVTVSGAAVVALALGAAVLWAGGTVLGRLAGTELGPIELTTLRFTVGLPASAIIVATTASDWWVPDLRSSGAVLGLALVPSLLAVVLYYRGLRRTAAARATLAELAYPVVGAVVGVWLSAGRSPLTTTQWWGAAVVVSAVTALSLHEARARTQAVVAAESDAAAAFSTPPARR